MKAVTLDDILVKPKKIEIMVPGKESKTEKGTPEFGKFQVWIRPSQQPERDLAAAAARKASRLFRKTLETEGTEERELLVLDAVESAPIDSLRDLWVGNKVAERAIRIRNNSLEDRDYVPEPEGDNVTSKMIDDYENEVEAVEDAREMGVIEAILAARGELDKEVQNIPEDQLIELAIPAQIELVLERLYQAEFVHQLIYRCTFKDQKCTVRAFDHIEEVYNLKDAPKTKLANAHTSFLLDPEQVKNLAGGLKS